MKKFLLAGMLAALAFAAVPSHAQVLQPNATSCVITPDAAEDEVCTFTSTGLTVQIVVATPNPWSVTSTYVVNGVTKTRDSESSGDLNPAGQGPFSINATKGDTVTVIEYQDGVDPIVGEGGFVIAGEAN